MDLSQYRELFVSEAKGHLQAFGRLIMQLEGEGSDQAAIDELFRHAHSLKGMAATMQYHPVASLAHSAEDILGRVRDGQYAMAPRLADLLLAAGDALDVMVTAIENSLAPEPDTELLQRLADYSPDPPDAPAAAGTPPCAVPSEAQPPSLRFRQSDTFRSIRVKTGTLDRLVDITGSLINIRHHLDDRARRHPEAGMEAPLGQLARLLRELRDEVFSARMLPFSLVAERFPRLVRDLARSQGKEVAFLLTGREIELDRSILEEIAEPLVHILRNAVDHGIEPPAERAAAGKPPCGALEIAVCRDRDRVDIVISDDGRGISPERIIAKAREKGLITAAQASRLTPQEALQLVCLPGFSTAETVSEVSGRGVGMDAVREAVHSLGGNLLLESEPGHGSRITLRLPVSVSIIHALMARCGSLTVAFPVGTVRRTAEVERTLLQSDAPLCDGEAVTAASLNRLLGQPEPDGCGETVPAVLTETGPPPLLVTTDLLVGQREIFVKQLAPPLSRLRSITGGAILGDGSIVFIMDPASLADMAATGA